LKNLKKLKLKKIAKLSPNHRAFFIAYDKRYRKEAFDWSEKISFMR
jgi:hypothetical protein